MTKPRKTFVRRPGAAPTAEALMERGTDGGGIRFAQTDLSRPRQRYTLVDLAFDPNQPRDSKGRWTKTGGGLVPAARLSEAATERLDTAEADPRFKTFTVSGASGRTTPERRDNPKTKAEVWHATPAERRAMLADNEEDPLDGKTEAELFEMLDSDDPAERKQALVSVEARRKRMDLLEEAAVAAAKTRDLKASLSKWDERVSRVPGGKAVVKWKNRLAKEETVVKAEKVKHTTTEAVVEIGIHAAIGTAIIGLGAMAAGYASMKHGGDATAMQNAMYEFNHLLHGGPKIGQVPLNEILAWVGGAAGTKAAIAHRAALKHPLKRRREKKARQAAALAAIVAEQQAASADFSTQEPNMDIDLTLPGPGRPVRPVRLVGPLTGRPRQRKRATAIRVVNAARRDKRLRARGVVRAGAQQRMLNSI